MLVYITPRHGMGEQRFALFAVFAHICISIRAEPRVLAVPNSSPMAASRITRSSKSAAPSSTCNYHVRNTKLSALRVAFASVLYRSCRFQSTSAVRIRIYRSLVSPYSAFFEGCAPTPARPGRTTSQLSLEFGKHVHTCHLPWMPQRSSSK